MAHLGLHRAAMSGTSSPENLFGRINMDRDDDTVYCDIQMRVAQGRERLELVSALRESRAHPSLDKVIEHKQDEFSTSIDIADNPPTWGPWCQ